MKARIFKSLIFAVCGCFCALCAMGATSLFSDYGQIQNVQHYSTNPFWTPNSPYNQRMPQPVYVQGTDISADECLKVVSSLVSVQCMARDNCKNTQLSDIRPTVMIQLSNLPGHNYVSACAGYIDYIYEQYVKQYGNQIPTRQVAFPTATTPNPDAYNNEYQMNIPNPYKQPTPKWQQEMNERSQELKDLQQQNGADNFSLSATDFPETYADLSFSERMANDAAGYAPYFDKNGYYTLDVKDDANWCADHIDNPECADYKKNENNEFDTNEEMDAEEAEIVNAIVEFLNPQNNDEKVFFTALAVAYVKAEDKDASLMLDDKFVYNFLSENNNLEKYKKGLLNLSGTAQNEHLKIDLDWDEILIQVSTVLDATLRRRGALVCENNRSYEISIDTATWVATAAAAIASFGSGGVAVAGGRAAIGAGLKALAKGAAKVGLKSAAKSISKQGGKQLAKAAVKVHLKTSMKGYVKYKGKGLAKRIAIKAGERFIQKRGWMLATGAVAGAIYETVGTSAIANNSTPVKKNGQNTAGTIYSLVNSEPSTEIIGCQDLDYGEGCYAVCGHDQPDDDLNTKVFKPLLGRNYCVSEQDYTLYDMDTNRPLMLTDTQYKQVTEKIRQDVADKGENKDKWGTMWNQKNARHGCDWNEDDIDMYFGSYIYNPETLEPSTSMIIEEFIRIDD